MPIVIISIIVAMIGVAASLYQISAQSPDVREVIVQEYWWMTWPM
jgi:hypothetical protein